MTIRSPSEDQVDRDEPTALLRALVDHVPAMLAYWDRTQRCRFANRAYETWFGVRPEDLIGKEMRELLGPIYPLNLPFIEGALRGEEQTFEREIPDPEGGPPRYSQAHYIPDVRDGIVRGFFVLVANITDRRRAEEATRKAEQALRVAIENAPVGMALVSLTGRWLLVNRVLCEMLGYTAEELQTLTSQQLTHPADVDLDVEQAQALLRGERSRYTKAKRYMHKDGRIVDAMLHVGLVRNQHGQPDHLITQIEDLTERKRLQEKIIVADRLASVGALAGGVAHEVNNPLACVLANLETLTGEARARLTSGDAAASRSLELLAEAHEAAGRVRDIVRDLRLFARGSSAELEAIDVVEVLRTALRLTSNEIRHRARLVEALGPLPSVDGDSGKLSQVLISLLVTAARALPDGHADTQRVAVRSFTDTRGWAVIEVQDTGRGLAPEDLDHIFDPFFTTRAVGQGPGLELSVAHGIVSAMGGEIVAASVVGAGTTMTIRLPPGRLARPSEAAPVSLSLETAAPAARPRVLVVDDERMVARAVGRLLGEDNEVTVTGSAEEALERLAGASFDVIVSDLMMPGMTGMELHAALVERAPAQAERMIFMTGGAFTATARAFLDHVPNPRVDKPIDAANLRALVRHVATRGARSKGAA